MLGDTESKSSYPELALLTRGELRFSAVWLRRSPSPEGRGREGLGWGEARPAVDGRVSCTLDLAAAIRLCAGVDITPQWCGVSSIEETGNVWI